MIIPLLLTLSLSLIYCFIFHPDTLLVSGNSFSLQHFIFTNSFLVCTMYICQICRKKGISQVFQKLSKFFSIVFWHSYLRVLLVLFKNFDLSLNDSESLIGLFDLSLQKIMINLQMLLDNCHYIS